MLSRHATLALEALSRARSLAQKLLAWVRYSKDETLKAEVARLGDELNTLRESLIKLAEEAASHGPTQILGVTPPGIRHVGRANYYFRGEDGPYCQKCYEKDRQLRLLNPRCTYPERGMGRECRSCKTVYIETV